MINLLTKNYIELLINNIYIYIYIYTYIHTYRSELGFQFAFISDIHTRYLTDVKAIKSIALFGNLKGITLYVRY